jgi:hypothetical protein
LSLIGNVLGRARIDVCGKLVDTYTVALQGVLTSPTVQYLVSWRLQIATQYGGAIVQDELSLTSVIPGYTWQRTLQNTTVPKAKA